MNAIRTAKGFRVMPTKQKSLLEQAKEVKSPRLFKKEFSEEQIELALAWVSGEVSFSQVVKVCENTNPYAFLARALRQWFHEKDK